MKEGELVHTADTKDIDGTKHLFKIHLIQIYYEKKLNISFFLELLC